MWRVPISVGLWIHRGPKLDWALTWVAKSNGLQVGLGLLGVNRKIDLGLVLGFDSVNSPLFLIVFFFPCFFLHFPVLGFFISSFLFLFSVPPLLSFLFSISSLSISARFSSFFLVPAQGGHFLLFSLFIFFFPVVSLIWSLAFLIITKHLLSSFFF